MDEAAHKFDEHAPSLVKQVATQVTCLVQEVTHKAEKVVTWLATCLAKEGACSSNL